MRKKFFQKIPNIFLAIVTMGFLFLNPVVAASFNDVMPEYSTGVFDAADTAQGNLAFYDASRGFFLLPLSANGIPDGALPTDNPILALPDTVILSDRSSSNTSGLVIYRVDGTLWVNTFVGKGNESAHSASYFGKGDFVMVTTAEPDQCDNLTLSECRFGQYVLKEIPFSIQ